MSYRLGVDTGGTFTDIALIEEQTGKVHIAKVPSTPQDPSVAVLNGLQEIVKQTGIAAEEITFFIHGSTVATNALLEQNGAKTALITTSGFRDVLEIGRQSRPKLYDFKARKKPPFVPRHLRFEVTERLKFNGEVVKPLDVEEVRGIAQQLKDQGVQAVAVCLLHSYINASHERLIREIVLEVCPEILITLSSEVLPEFKEYERTSTVVANAYVLPKMRGYLNRLVHNLNREGVSSDLYIMQSNGGIITSQSAMETPARTVLSGPAGGILAGLFIVETTGHRNLITIDMGGTSLDTALIENGQPQYSTMNEIEGHPIKLPMIDMHTIGAGGGSIAWIDNGGALRVGPQSAGAFPGPVCYNRGGMEPTVTDANVILGRINPGYILNGKMKMNVELARQVMKEKIGDPLGITVEEAAQGIIQIVNANMVRGIRVVSIEKGHDPRDFSLVAFGGAGPLHASDIGKELGSKEIIVPPNPGITCAMGMLMADVRHDYVQTCLTDLDRIDLHAANRIIRDMSREALEQLAQEGFEGEAVRLEAALDLRYARQAYEIEVSLDGLELTSATVKEAGARFHQLHGKMYGFSREGETVELVNIRLNAVGVIPKIEFSKEQAISADRCEPLARRNVFFDGEFVETPVYHRKSLRTDLEVTGPAIVEQLDSTIVIHPDQYGVTDRFGNLIIYTKA